MCFAGVSVSRLCVCFAGVRVVTLGGGGCCPQSVGRLCVCFAGVSVGSLCVCALLGYRL